MFFLKKNFVFYLQNTKKLSTFAPAFRDKLFSLKPKVDEKEKTYKRSYKILI